eukprot:TRINITY_DN194_c0_g1_i2.p1 TRINITY_DN194_c0_g1~~TRINITY_DN194_c0_g1_i2.p1  ORF type:complete len:201 (-),score=32.16 TRINITY_DN194_c0_g1_i2:36-638(-)
MGDEIELKLLIIGDADVGKSSLLLRYVDDTFQESFITLGVDFKQKKVQVSGKTVNLIIWDTAGQERFRTITSSFFRGADGVIITYDVTNKATYENVPNWLQEIDHYTEDTVYKVIVGNKKDNENERAVDFTTAKEYALDLGLDIYETSAKTGEGVNDMFINIATKMYKQSSNEVSSGSSDTIAGKDGFVPPKKKKSGCVV